VTALIGPFGNLTGKPNRFLCAPPLRDVTTVALTYRRIGLTKDSSANRQNSAWDRKI
jgi:hypothetical protein